MSLYACDISERCILGDPGTVSMLENICCASSPNWLLWIFDSLGEPSSSQFLMSKSPLPSKTSLSNWISHHTGKAEQHGDKKNPKHFHFLDCLHCHLVANTNVFVNGTCAIVHGYIISIRQHDMNQGFC